MFNPNTSLLAGLSTAALQQALQDAQQAYIDLSTGAKGESFSYTQGDGAKSVTYTRANIGQLQMLIRQLQQQLGIIPRARRAIRPIF
ncbi:gpW family protein [Chromobacterium sp. S0633]|uniref:gpW family protein n=1 Tax=Chromobacterium sp. S0633 TaxID=2957805 RepID=UPI0020A20C83|nr:gpW family protein [Chromobacterium sp. S0633]MCP1290924.1 gpW family protein [Chromobacterium sp. S0633]